jgi:GT2 family glycosyltransferase
LLDRPEILNSAGGAVHFLGLGWAIGYGEPASRYADPRDVAAASGAGMAMRASIFAELGGFTEELFLYHEDAELSLRCWLSGRRVVFVPTAHIAHEYEFSRHAAKLYFLERNRLVVVITCYQRRTLLLLAPALVLYELGMVVVACSQGWGRDKLRGWRWLWEQRTWLRAQRQEVQARRRVADHSLARLLSARFDSTALPASAVVAFVDRLLAAYWRLVRTLV